MKNIKYIILLLVLLISTETTAQNVTIYKTDGTEIQYFLENIDSLSFYEENFECVDLGLPSGLKWGTCNIGAQFPEDYGNYYSWGEVESKDNYSWITYKLCNGQSNMLTKYCMHNYYGNVDGRSVLDEEDDVASVKFSKNCRIPTNEEFMELITYCTCEWITLNGTNGCQFTGPNGNRIFMPAAGVINETQKGSIGSEGRYWTSSLDESSMTCAEAIHFTSGWISPYKFPRYQGLNIRAVSTAIFVPGDINSDGMVNVGDLTMLIGLVMDSYQEKDEVFAAADMNGDGILNVGDITLLISVIMNSN